MTRLPAGWSSTSIPGLAVLVLVGDARRGGRSPPGKSVAATSAKCCSTAANVSSKRRSTVSVSSSRSCSSSASERSRSSRCSVSSSSRAFSRACSSAASGLTWPSCSRRRSRRASWSRELVAPRPRSSASPSASSGSRREHLVALGLEPRAARSRPPRAARPPRPPPGAARPRAPPRRRSSSPSSPARLPPASTRARSGGSRRAPRSAAAASDAAARSASSASARRASSRVEASGAERRGLGARREPALPAGERDERVAPLGVRLLQARDGLGELDALRRPGAGRGQRPLVARRLRRRGQARPVGVGAQRSRRLLGPLAPQLEPLDRAPQR